MSDNINAFVSITRRRIGMYIDQSNALQSLIIESIMSMLMYVNGTDIMVDIHIVDNHVRIVTTFNGDSKQLENDILPQDKPIGDNETKIIRNLGLRLLNAFTSKSDITLVAQQLKREWRFMNGESCTLEQTLFNTLTAEFPAYIHLPYLMFEFEPWDGIFEDGVKACNVSELNDALKALYGSMYMDTGITLTYNVTYAPALIFYSNTMMSECIHSENDDNIKE